MIFSEIVLDISKGVWYIIQARVEKVCVQCDEAGDCAHEAVTSAEYVRSSGG